MPAFSAAMFPDTVLFQEKTRPTPVDELGGPDPTWDEPGIPLSCYVEVVYDRVQRDDVSQQQPKSQRIYRVFTSSDTGARIDDHAGWNGRTLVVKEPSVIQEPLWMFECLDVE